MERVDFGYVGKDESTIYRACFNQYLTLRYTLGRPKSEWSKLVQQTETVFDFLVDQGINNGYDVDTILEIPDSAGGTCFSIASNGSEKICNFIIGREISVNSINTDMNRLVTLVLLRPFFRITVSVGKPIIKKT